MLPFFPLLLLVSPVFSTDSCHPETKVLTNLWRVSADPPSYFFGTIHVPYTRVWDGISEQAKGAFQSADQVYLESVGDGFVTKTCQLLPFNKSLVDMLSPDLMRRLRDHLDWLRTEMPSWLTPLQKLSGLTYDALTNNLERMRPWWLR